MSEHTLRAYNAVKDEMFAPAVLPANVIGAGLTSSLRSGFHAAAQGAAVLENDNDNVSTAPKPVQDQSARNDIAERANLVGQTLSDPSQKGMKVQSAAGYLGGQMAEMGKELMTGLFGALKDKKPDNDPELTAADVPRPAMRSAPTPPSGM